MPEKTVSILNLSKVGRKYHVQGAEKAKDRDGNPIYETIIVLPNQKAVEVPEASARFLLAKNPNGRAKFPDLIDASQFRPELAQEKDAALAENAKLLKENESLKSKLQEAGLLGENGVNGDHDDEDAKGKKGGKKR